MSLSNNFPTIAPSLSLDFANVGALDPRITFVRTTTATYYGTETAKAEENLLLFSQEFSNSSGWTNTNSTDVTEDTIVAPDGTTTAEGFLETAVTGSHGMIEAGTDLSLVAGTYTTSCWIKANGRTAATIILSRNAASAHIGAVFDLTGVSVTQTMDEGSGFTHISSSITEIPSGSGWYRCVLTGTVPAATNYFVGIYSSDATTYSPDTIGRNSFAGDITQGLFLWGAQLEQRSTVTNYTPTTTQPITNYIPVLEVAAAGEARFDHNPLTFESLGLLVEEQRTNLLLRSEEFANAGWTKSDSTITSNTIVAPDGTLTGNAVNDTVDVANTAHQITQGVSVTSGTACTLSAYIKAGTGVGFSLGAASAGAFSAEQRVLFNASTGVATSQLGTATNITMTLVGNGWYRCSCVITPTSTATATIVIRLNNSAASGFYQGNGTQNAFLWGTQFEAGAFPTSYIQTVAATVTRNADVASMTGTNFSSWYRADVGTLYAEAQTVNFAGDRGIWAAGNNSLGFGSGNMIYEVFTASASGRRVVNVFYNGSQQASIGTVTSQTVNTFSKGSVAYKTNDFAQSTNAAIPATDTSGLVPLGVTGLSIGSLSSGWSGGATFINGTIKKIAFYPARLSDSQLQALTTV